MHLKKKSQKTLYIPFLLSEVKRNFSLFLFPFLCMSLLYLCFIYIFFSKCIHKYDASLPQLPKKLLKLLRAKFQLGKTESSMFHYQPACKHTFNSRSVKKSIYNIRTRKYDTLKSGLKLWYYRNRIERNCFNYPKVLWICFKVQSERFC